MIRISSTTIHPSIYHLPVCTSSFDFSPVSQQPPPTSPPSASALPFPTSIRRWLSSGVPRLLYSRGFSIFSLCNCQCCGYQSKLKLTGRCRRRHIAGSVAGGICCVSACAEVFESIERSSRKSESCLYLRESMSGGSVGARYEVRATRSSAYKEFCSHQHTF